jgi:predicted ArsR family transcriptional regulator
MRQVLGWIRARGAARISREDVRRDALGQALNAHQSLQVIQALERAGFLRKAEADYAGNGRPALRWDVNPALIGQTLAETADTPAALGGEAG